jgi:molybdate transport system substrate-binding protein
MLSRLGGLVAALVWATGLAGAKAAEIKVLTAGAMRSVITQMAPDFEKQTGHKIAPQNDTAGGLAKRISGGEPFDVAVITPAIVDDLIRQGKIAPGTRTNLAKVGMGVGVKEGAARPDIGSVEAFKRALLAAKSIAYIDPKAGGSSGIYFDKLIERLGIADEVRAKAMLRSGGYVAELVAAGEAELAVHQISEIVPVKGVFLAGPLPAEVQNFTVYAAGLGAGAQDPAAAKALIEFLAGPGVGPALASKGMEKP